MKRVRSEVLLFLSMVVLVELEVVAAVIVAIVMERNAVELLKGIDHLAHGCGKPRIQGYAFRPRSANVNALAFLHIAEVRRFHSPALVGDDGWFRVPQ